MKQNVTAPMYRLHVLANDEGSNKLVPKSFISLDCRMPKTLY